MASVTGICFSLYFLIGNFCYTFKLLIFVYLFKKKTMPLLQSRWCNKFPKVFNVDNLHTVQYFCFNIYSLSQSLKNNFGKNSHICDYLYQNYACVYILYMDIYFEFYISNHFE